MKRIFFISLQLLFFGFNVTATADVECLYLVNLSDAKFKKDIFSKEEFSVKIKEHLNKDRAGQCNHVGQVLNIKLNKEDKAKLKTILTSNSKYDFKVSRSDYESRVTPTKSNPEGYSSNVVWELVPD